MRKKEGEGGATIFYNIFRRTKVPNAWHNIPFWIEKDHASLLRNQSGVIMAGSLIINNWPSQVSLHRPLFRGQANLPSDFWQPLSEIWKTFQTEASSWKTFISWGGTKQARNFTYVFKFVNTENIWILDAQNQKFQKSKSGNTETKLFSVQI